MTREFLPGSGWKLKFPKELLVVNRKRCSDRLEPPLEIRTVPYDYPFVQGIIDFVQGIHELHEFLEVDIVEAVCVLFELFNQNKTGKFFAWDLECATQYQKLPEIHDRTLLADTIECGVGPSGLLLPASKLKNGLQAFDEYISLGWSRWSRISGS